MKNFLAGKSLVAICVFAALALLGGVLYATTRNGDTVSSADSDPTSSLIDAQRLGADETEVPPPTTSSPDNSDVTFSKPDPTVEPEKSETSETTAPDSTATEPLKPKTLPTVKSKEFTLSKVNAKTVALKGSVRGCADVPNLLFRYTAEGKSFTSPVVCKGKTAAVSETIPVAKAAGPVVVTFEVRDTKKSYDNGKVTADFTPKKPVDSAFAAPPPNSGSGRRIVYSNQAQRVWLMDSNESIIDSYLVSGRKGTPDSGTYQVFSKSEKALAGHDGITMDYMVRFIRPKGEDLSIGFHGIPRYADGKPLQSNSELGKPRSAGCVRQSDAAAKRLYAWATVGTTVVVLP